MVFSQGTYGVTVGVTLGWIVSVGWRVFTGVAGRAGVAVAKPSLVKTRLMTSPDSPSKPRSVWLKITCTAAPSPVSSSTLLNPENWYAFPGTTLPLNLIDPSSITFRKARLIGDDVNLDRLRTLIIWNGTFHGCCNSYLTGRFGCSVFHRDGSIGASTPGQNECLIEGGGGCSSQRSRGQSLQVPPRLGHH